MNKLSLSILILLGISAFSQTGADSIRINYLKNQLHNSSGTKKVDLLNEIGWEYGWATLKDKSPVVIAYAIQAKDLASQLNYKRGIGYALITLSWWRNDNCDSLISAAMSIGEKEKDNKLLGRVYHRKWEMKTAFDYYKKAGDVQGEAEAATWLCTEYAAKGQYDNGFNYCQRAIELANIPKTSTPTFSSYISSLAFETMSKLYSKVGDHSTAFQYLKEAEKYSAEDLVLAYAEFYKEMSKYDSSVYYYEKALQKNPENGKLRKLVGTANFLAKNYLRAIELLEKGFNWETDPNFKWQLPVNWRGSQHLEVALSYHALKNIERAEKHYLAALKYQQSEYQKILNEPNPNITAFQKASQLMDISYGLSKSFYGLRNADSAYIYLEKYIHYKNQVNNINTVSLLNMQLNSYKKEATDLKRTSQINLLQKDNLIKEQMLQEDFLIKQQQEVQLALLDKTNQLKDQQLKEEGLTKEQNRSQLALLDKENKLKDQQLKQQSLLKNALVAGFFLLLLLGIIIIRNIYLKRKNEKLQLKQREQEWKVKELQSENKHVELLKQAADLEMQALRAQMNPHFIFNCLSSINRFILKNEGKTASNYLTRFSRLMRMVLNNSQKPLISLDDELEMLELYLEMERLRFKNSFDYGITFLNAVDSDNVFIPPLLLQPFCENAIWHGLMNKEGQGRLDIELSIQDNILNCLIRDNGVGREKAEELKSKTAEKEKSMGLKITTERLALLNREKGLHTFYEIEDLKDEKGLALGTTVNLKISYKHNVEEYAS